MKEIILIKTGEIALKGLNKSSFEDVLVKNTKWRLHSLGQFKFRKAQSTIYCEPQSDDMDLDEACRRVSHVFGIAAFSRARVAAKDFEDICENTLDFLGEELEYAATFKVEAKRADKSFPMKSPEICRELGGRILERYPHLKVDVEHPDVLVMVEIRETAAYIHGKQLPGAGGIPIGTSGKAAILISGGIDSPVAGYMMAKRGLELCGVHFASPPYTSERAKQKVIALMEKMAEYCGRMKLFVVPFTEIQEQIRDKCPEELFTIIMRRFMMRIADQVARKQDCGALITSYVRGAIYRLNTWTMDNRPPEKLSYFGGDVFDVVDDDPASFQQEALEGVYKMEVYSNDTALLAELREKLVKAGLSVSSSFKTNIEITSQGLGKGQAVAWLARHLGIDREQVMCFGDNTNGASMLRAAGVGVAMGNAVAELKAQANLVAPPCAEDGLARLLRDCVFDEEA